MITQGGRSFFKDEQKEIQRFVSVHPLQILEVYGNEH